MRDYETVTLPKKSSSPEQTGAAGKARNTSMPAERYQTNSESAISPLDETENFSLMLSRDEEMEILQPLSILNPEEMDDTELLKDLRSLGKPPSFDGKETMPVNTAVDTREMFKLESSGQKYRKEILPLGEQVLAPCPGVRVNEHHRAIREKDNQVNQHTEMPQIQYTDKVADDPVAVQRQVSPRTPETKHRIFKLTVNICKQRIFRLIDLAHEITGVKVAQKTWHKLLDDRQHATESSHIASTKEVVADDTANSNTDITLRVTQTTLSDFSENLEEPSPTENEKGTDDQTRRHGFSRDIIFVQTLEHCSFRTRS